jgi:DNA-binding response OmpR family regulator
MKTKILLIEGKHSDYPSFVNGLTKKSFQVDSVPNGNAALKRLYEVRPHLLIVNAASLRTSGVRICQALRRAAPGIPLLVIVEENAAEDKKLQADVVLHLPFTLQKLINRIQPLLPTSPANLLQAGPIQLDLQNHIVRCYNRQTRLTPRLMTLLRILMEHPGEVVERETLFCEAWQTNYAGDMRTLDVHISWLRQAIEEDPRNPRLIKTLRGQGYRLDLGDFDTPTQPLPQGNSLEQTTQI